MWTILLTVDMIFFWVLLSIVGIICIITTEKEEPFFTFVFVMGTLVGMALFTNVNPFTWIFHNLDRLLIYFAAYVLAGILYGCIKWVTYCYDEAKAFRVREPGAKQSWLSWHSDTKQSYPEYLQSTYGVPPSPIKNYWRIITWMAYWPFSGLWTLIRFPAEYIWDFAYEMMASAYAAVSRGIFNHIFGKGWDVLTAEDVKDKAP